MRNGIGEPIRGLGIIKLAKDLQCGDVIDGQRITAIASRDPVQFRFNVDSDEWFEYDPADEIWVDEAPGEIEIIFRVKPEREWEDLKKIKYKIVWHVTTVKHGDVGWFREEGDAKLAADRLNELFLFVKHREEWKEGK